jgi:hypothetical protein
VSVPSQGFSLTTETEEKTVTHLKPLELKTGMAFSK